MNRVDLHAQSLQNPVPRTQVPVSGLGLRSRLRSPRAAAQHLGGIAARHRGRWIIRSDAATKSPQRGRLPAAKPWNAPACSRR